jgi:acyl-CoA reductase-like NAD-dependent aldehyde dehydrogenase
MSADSEPYIIQKLLYCSNSFHAHSLAVPLVMPDVPFTTLLINGERRRASTGATFEVRNPHTGVLASIAASASSDDCRAAIEAAHRAFPAWEETPSNTRRQILVRALATLESEEWQKKAAASMRAEVAMPESHVIFNLRSAPGALSGFTCLVNELKGETLPSIIPGGQVFVQRRALGVVCVFPTSSFLFPPQC